MTTTEKKTPEATATQKKRSSAVEAFLKLTAKLSDEDRELLRVENGFNIAEGGHDEHNFAYVCGGCGELGLVFVGPHRPNLIHPAHRIAVMQGSFTSEDVHRPCCKNCREQLVMGSGKYKGEYLVHIEEWRQKKAEAKKLTAEFSSFVKRAPLKYSSLESEIEGGGIDSGWGARTSSSEIVSSAESETDQSIASVREAVELLDDKFGFTENLIKDVRRR